VAVLRFAQDRVKVVYLQSLYPPNLRVNGSAYSVVEDEAKLARFVELELSYEGYRVSVMHDGLAGCNSANLILI